MKRFLLSCILCMMTLFVMCQYVTVDGILYKAISQTEAEATCLKDRNSTKEDVVIPQYVEIDGIKLRVVSIDGFAFSNVKSISIPEGVTVIKDGAFSGCDQLVSVEFPNSLKTIGEEAFSNCTHLTSVIIPESTTVIGTRAFHNCASLMSINIPGSVEAIEKFAFYKCTNLSSITIGEGVTTINEGAFWECKALETVIIPNTVKYIGSKAFWQCVKLEKMTLPDNAKIDSSDDNTFLMLCESLKTIEGHNYIYPKWLITHLKKAIYVPNSVTEWISNAETALSSKDFNNKKMAVISPHDGITYKPISETEAEVYIILDKTIVKENIRIPEYVIINEKEYRVTTIRNAAFLGCSKLKSIFIPNSITSIGMAAFQGCRNLASVTLPKNISEIKTCTFLNCTALKNITIPEGVTTIGASAFNSSAIVSISLPSSLDSIGIGAFCNCTNLKNIRLPNKITTIEEGLFLNCKSLREVILPNTVRLIKGMAFFRCLDLETVVVPDNTAIEYCKPYKMEETVDNLKHLDSSLDVNDVKQRLSVPDNLHPFALCEKLTSIRGYETLYPKWAVEHLQKETNLPIKEWAKEAIAKIDMDNSRLVENHGGNASVTQVTDNSIDKNIPIVTADNSRTFAIIIGNENYKEVENVPHALNDARIFAVYCEKTLGVPSKNIKVYEDATFGTILSAIEYLQQVAKAFQGNINVIFYYAGHGVPNETTNEAYLLPVDANGRNTAACYQINKLYSELKGLNANQVTVFLDACFSGAQRGNGMLASSRGIAFNTKQAAPQGNMVVFSAASADETAYPFNEKGHGLFTYYLLKKLNETKGNVTLGELGKYICEKVTQESIVTNGKSQTPTVVSSANIATNWMEMKLIK